MLVIVAPGQGAQSPGFLRPWLELPGLRERLEAFSEAAEVDLLTHGTTSDEETIRDTAVAQPLIVAAGLLALPVALGEAAAAEVATAVGGHSVGEITAAAMGGVLTDAEAMALVGARGRAMARAAAVTQTGMSAVLGGAADEVLAAIERHGLTPANVNGAGQVVAAGTIDQLSALAQDPPARTRIIGLSVAGAFHTSHMAPAIDDLADHVATVQPGAPTVSIVSNADGAVVGDGAEVLSRLVSQVASPVRWDRCMDTLVELGVTGLLELPPAGTLVGLAKRGMRGVQSVALRTPDDLPAARALIADHGGTTTDGGSA